MGDNDYSCDLSGKSYCFLREPFIDKMLASKNLDEVLQKEHIIGAGTLYDITEGCNNNCKRRQIAERVFTRRVMEQFRCIADYRWILGERGIDVDMEEAGRLWVKDGFAGEFEIVYERKKQNGEIIRHRDLYKETEIKCR